MISYHCTLCDKDFIEKDLAAEHRKETRHEIIKRQLSK